VLIYCKIKFVFTCCIELLYLETRRVNNVNELLLIQLTQIHTIAVGKLIIWNSIHILLFKGCAATVFNSELVVLLAFSCTACGDSSGKYSLIFSTMVDLIFNKGICTCSWIKPSSCVYSSMGCTSAGDCA